MNLDYNEPSIADEIELVQSLINDKGPGNYEAMSILKGYENYIDSNVNFGMRLREYVHAGKLNNIEALYIERGSKHWVYALHGGNKPID